MPKPTKLHTKGKPNSIQKIHKTDKEVSDSADRDPDESVRQFQLELCWCIQQLERSLSEKKGNEKQMQEVWKVLTVLKNNNQPVIRKRQLMRTHFGDYRAKMAAEEKKLSKMASKIKISDTPTQPKATFLRKSAFLSTGDNSFKFDFNLAPDQIDNSKNVVNTDSSSNIQPVSKPFSLCNSSDGNPENVSKNFKFVFSGSDFKFNFDANEL